MKKIAIIGAGGFAREVRGYINSDMPSAVVDFYVEDGYAGGQHKTVSSIDYSVSEILVAVGDPIVRRRIVRSLPPHARFATFVHASAILCGPDVSVGPGTIICPGVIITCSVEVGSHVHLNLQTTIGHDSRLGDFVTTAPGVKISGNCIIGDAAYLGTNAAIREGLSVVGGATIGMGAAVIKRIDDVGVFGGVPARRIK